MSALGFFVFLYHLPTHVLAHVPQAKSSVSIIRNSLLCIHMLLSVLIKSDAFTSRSTVILVKY